MITSEYLVIPRTAPLFQQEGAVLGFKLLNIQREQVLPSSTPRAQADTEELLLNE